MPSYHTYTASYLPRPQEGQARDGRLVRREGGVGEARGVGPELHLGVVSAGDDRLVCLVGVWLVVGGWGGWDGKVEGGRSHTQEPDGSMHPTHLSVGGEGDGADAVRVALLLEDVRLGLPLPHQELAEGAVKGGWRVEVCGWLVGITDRPTDRPIGCTCL